MLETMISEELVEKTVRDLFENIRFTQEPADLYDPLRYMIAIGGKRLRPRLCLLTYSLFRDSFHEGILQPAAGLEVFHTFTLIHDDIMDRSALRRGHETVWKKWSSDTAILSGDVMCIDSYKRIARAPAAVLPQVMELFSRTAAEVCDGQQYDMDFEHLAWVSMEQYMQMIGLKTGVLIACAARMGAMIAGAPEEVCEALYRYGYDLGLAFQVADDYLDAYGEEKVFGKPIGGDILNDKKSWLTVRALEKANGSAQTRAALDAAFALPDRTREEQTAKIAAVKAVYDAVGIPTDARAEIARLSAAALAHVEALAAPSAPLSPTASVPATPAAGATLSPEALSRLRTFADRLVGRTF